MKELVKKEHKLNVMYTLVAILSSFLFPLSLSDRVSLINPGGSVKLMAILLP